MAFDIWQELKPKQTAIELALNAWLDRLTSGAPPILVEAMRYSLLAPGKRLRPLLCVLACEAVGGEAAMALPAACAVEMIHTYSLIHDDLPAMDDDDLRRGLPTSHKKFGDALAILAGDALQGLAFEVLAEGYTPALASVCVIELARGAGAIGMVGGQVLDLAAEGKIDQPSLAEPSRHLEAIHALKTGALFRSALRLGLYSAHAERHPDAAKLIEDYAAAFGLAFQVTDDLLDVESSSETTGKRVGKDAARGKLTYPSLLGTEASRAKAVELGQRAIQAAEGFGERGRLLAELADYVVQRDR